MMCLLGGFSSSLMAQDVTIGNLSSTLSSSANYPFCNTYTYSLSQQIYSPDIIKSYNNGESPEGKITKIKYYIAETYQEYFGNVRVYMRNSDVSAFTGATSTLAKQSWDKDFTTEDLLFKGDVNIVDNTIEIVFNQGKEFTYDPTKNLIIYIDVESKNGTDATKFKYTSKDGYNANITYKSLLYHRNQTRNGGLTDNGLGDYGWSTASGSAASYLSVVTLTFSSGGGSTETLAPTAPTLNYPSNNQDNVFNPFLRFTLGSNTTHYQILMGTGTGEMTVLTGDWVEKTVAEVDFQTSDLQPNTTYIWKVVAKNDKPTGVKETSSDEYSFTTKEFSAPGQISDAYPNGLQDLVNPEFTWTFGDDTEEYQVIIDGEAKTEWTNKGSSTTGSYQTSGLSAGEHTWRIDAKNYVATTTGTEYSFTVASLPDNVTPISPVDGATGVASNVVRFQFAPNTTEYRLLCSDTNTDEMAYITVAQGGTGSTWTSTGGATEMSFTIPYFGLGKTLYWAVEVGNAIGKRSVNSNNDEEKAAIYSFTAASTLPVANAAPSNGANNLDNPELSWNFKGNATHYMVYLGTEENNLTAQTEWLARGTEGTGLAGSGSYQTADLTPSTQYFWRVDVKEGENSETVLAGDVWSFVTTLPTPEAQANPAKVVPSFGIVYGGTTINWGKIETAQGYNVYLDGVKLNDELIHTNTNYYAIPANSMKLQYNMTTGYTFNVEAVYEGLGSVMSEDVIVKVTGTGYLSATIYKNDYYNRLEGATITLSCTEDEFGNTYEEGNGRQYVLTTDSNGQYLSSTEGNERIQNGTYDVTVEKAYFDTYTGTITIRNNQTSTISEILTADNTVIFDVTLFNESFNTIDVYLENANWEGAQAGYYHVYLKNGEDIEDLGTQWFQAPNNMTTSVYITYTDWADLGKGNYQFGVSKIDGQINWSDVEVRSYDVFDGSGNWSTVENWRDSELPSEDANVYVLSSLTINEDEDITTGTVTILGDGNITINGSLTAGNVYNNTQAGALCINDGGQLRQNNQNLNGKFVMTVTPPTSWDESNIDGWQFIASPVKGVEFSNFVPANDVEGDYDLYQYDGDNNLWRNHKHEYAEGETAFAFGEEFKLGTAYLASLQYSRDVIFSGTFNAATTHQFEVSYTADNKAANFHLLGNPFTFDINTKYFQAAGLATGYAVMNEAGNDYEYFTEGTIPVGDGFFVFATEATASLKYAETRGAKEATDNINIVARGEAGSNNVIINFAEGESFRKLEGFNNEIANIYVASQDNKYAIYNCESDVNEVELTFVAKQMGSYSLSFDLNGEFESVVLVDRLTGVETDMIAEGEYNFIASSEDMKNRFVVRLANGEEATDDSQFVYQNGDELIINAEGAIEIIDMMGRVVYSSEANVNRVNVSNFNNAAYVVRALNEGKVQKVVIY